MGFSCLKRRNAQTSVRRAIKRNKATDGLFGSSIVYIKCLLIWVVLLVIDYLLDFRFEYLWPVWMLLRSVYDSFKFQGAILAALFGGLAVASDVVCYMLMPAHCLFFLASSYVWVQYVSQTERGVCLPTATLWLIFLYIEFTVRLRDVKQSSMSFTLDLCRPFAAHCVGYPVVTLGFGFKSYVQYRLRLKKQNQVRKQNDQYFDITKQALPIELQQPNGNCLAESNTPENGLPDAAPEKLADCAEACSTSPLQNGSGVASAHSKTDSHRRRNQNQNQNQNQSQNQSHGNSNNSTTSTSPYMQLSTTNGNAAGNSRESSTQRRAKAPADSVPLANGHSLPECNGLQPDTAASRSDTPKQQSSPRDELVGRLESELRRLRSDLQAARYTESELRSQISIYEKHEREARETMQQLRHDRDTFETKLNTTQQKFSTEKQALERQLRDERRLRQGCDEKIAHAERDRDELKTQLQAAQQLAAAQQVAFVAPRNSSSTQLNAAVGCKNDCAGECRNVRKKLENENKQLREQVARKTDELSKLDNEKQSLSVMRQSQVDVQERELKQTQERVSHLEKMLSDENRVKMDLVAALGDAKRQLELAHAAVHSREQELAELKQGLDLINTLLPGLNFAGLPSAANHAHDAHFMATSQNGTSRSSPSSTPLSFNPPNSSFNPTSGAPTPFNSVAPSAYHSGLYQNTPSVYDAFASFSPFDPLPPGPPTAFSVSTPVSAAIDAQQRARSPSVSSASQSGDAAPKSANA